MTVKELREALANKPDDLDVMGVAYDRCDDAYQTDIEELKTLSVKEYESMIQNDKAFISEGSSKERVLFLNMY